MYPSTDARSRTGPLDGFLDILRSEFIKLSSVRSTRWMLLAAVLANIGLAVLAAIFIPGHLSARDEQTVDGIRLSLAGLHLSQIAVGGLGVLAITSEYSTGLIRATFAAVPRRRTVLAAKAIVVATTALVVGVGSSFAAFFAFEAFLSGRPGDALRSSIGDPGVLRAVTGGGLYLAVLGLLGFGLGTIIRSGAGSIGTLLGLLFVPTVLLSLLPQSWQDTAGRYVPMEAGSQIFIAARRDPHSLGAWPGFGVFSLYAAVALAVGFALIGRRDA
jgi:ABC-2 type transport system permease protein